MADDGANAKRRPTAGPASVDTATPRLDQARQWQAEIHAARQSADPDQPGADLAAAAAATMDAATANLATDMTVIVGPVLDALGLASRRYLVQGRDHPRSAPEYGQRQPPNCAAASPPAG